MSTLKIVYFKKVYKGEVMGTPDSPSYAPLQGHSQ